MTMSLRPDVSGTYGAVQLNGVDKLLLNADSTLAGVLSPTKGDRSNNLATTSFLQSAIDTFTGRNRIINGDCRVAQWPTVTTATGGSGYSAVDRYIATLTTGSGGSLTQSQGTLTYSGIAKSCVAQIVVGVMTATTGTAAWSGVTQFIEGYNCADLLGKSVTVSFLWNSNVAGTFPVSLSDGPFGKSIVSTFTALANTPTKVSITFAIPSTWSIPNSNLAGLNLSIGAINTASYQAPATNTAYSVYYMTAPGCTNWATVAGNVIAVTDLQLEEGLTATPFERRPFGQELALCQRYFQNVLTSQMTPVTAAGASSVTALFPHHTPMRTLPTAVTNVVDSTFSNGQAGTPVSGQWSLLSSGVQYVTKTGTISFGIYTGVQYSTISLTGMTMSSTPNLLQMGANMYIYLTAELF